MKEKKLHCKRESENIQHNKLNNIYIVERVIDQIVILRKRHCQPRLHFS